MVLNAIPHFSNRKYTQKAALKLNLVGWVENTDVNTVIGEAQGSEEEMEEFKNWLFEGSPKSRVERVEFLEEGVVENPEYETFEIRR